MARYESSRIFLYLSNSRIFFSKSRYESSTQMANFLTKSGLKTVNTAKQNSSRAAVLVNTARPINTAYPRPTVNSARQASNVFKRSHSHVRRPFNKITANKNSNFIQKVNIVKGNVTTTRQKPVGNPQKELQEKGVIDSGCSRHMIGNISYRSQYEEIDGGYVAFRGDPKRGKTTGKGKISTWKLDFEDVYFVKELKFNLFSVSQMCDKKNGVLFTNTKCVVLSANFKLLDKSQILLRVPRKNNMYSVDLKNVAPSGGKKLALSFMRPFGCPVTILNTLDHLSKFDGKADEGFFVGYTVNSKAFRVFNSRTRIVEENLHITFLENKPNVVGSGPEWLFDIDTLTKSMNYKPVVTKNQTNGSACTKESIDAGQAGKKIEEEKKDDEDLVNEEEPRVNQENDASVNNTNTINTVSSTSNVDGIEDNAVNESIVYGCEDDLNMPNLEEIFYSEDDEGVGTEADMNNLNTFMPVSPIPTTRLHKDHPLKQIIKDIHLAPQTRRMTRSVTDHVEPKKVIQALADLSWIEAMQDELL
ncbi:putative ribonuclease H-like domain-containing protein, partial [Tanacetum coccineum]